MGSDIRLTKYSAVEF